MNLAKLALDNRAVAYFVLFLLVVAGTNAFLNLGQLEDPDFTIKTALVTTTYPGASAEEVEQEVTDRLELAMQELPQLDKVTSMSRAGFSQLTVDIKPNYRSSEIPQIWDELRRKVGDTASKLPPGANMPVVSDDFGDVFGFQLAVIGDGFNYAELEDYAKGLQKHLSLVKGVGRVSLWGAQKKVIYLEVAQSQLNELGLSEANLMATLQQQNLIVDAGNLDLQNTRFRIAPTGSFSSPEDIENLVITPNLLDLIEKKAGGQNEAAGQLIRIRDFGKIREAYEEPPRNILRFNGLTAIGISISNAKGVNIVEVGQAIDRRLDQLIADLPIGIEVRKVHWQSDAVATAVRSFMISFAEAVAIVLVVLTLVMGWRMGVIIGTALIATILASFILMLLFKIDLQRMSLGALIIALGMMVDNAIVVADGVVVRLQKGMDRNRAAIESARQPAIPLLGATVIAVMAFFPIFISDESAGEYCATLFSVVAISLLVSWLISMTITPLMCVDMLAEPKVDPDDGDVDPYGKGLFRLFGGFLAGAIRFRWLTVGVAVAALAVSIIGFGQVKQLFFPDSSMTKFMIDYWAPEGTRIETVTRDLKQAESHILKDKRVRAVATFIGSGPPRFYLPVSPEKPYASYAQLIVEVDDYRSIAGLIPKFSDWFRQEMPQAIAQARPFGVGPGETWKLVLRVIGPANADGTTLRTVAKQVSDIVEQSPLAGFVRTDWRQRTQKVVPAFNQEQALWAGVTREDLANATKRAFDGRVVGFYRERDDLIPIVLRHNEEDRANVGNLDIVNVQSPLSSKSVPLAQIVNGVNLKWEDPLIWRRDRRRTIQVQSNPVPGETMPSLQKDIDAKLAALKLPPGYLLEWGGETESSRKSQASLVPGVIPALAIIVLIIVALFNAYRPPLVILLTIPFAIIGITAGLLAFNVPFGFVALLGGMSLVGMMIKNAIVLLDEVNINLAADKSPYDAVIEAALSRLRPVMLAAGTTVLGVVPLMQDVFWIGLAVTVMAGLTFGSILTMVLVPVLYAILHRIHAPPPPAPLVSDAVTEAPADLSAEAAA